VETFFYETHFLSPKKTWKIVEDLFLEYTVFRSKTCENRWKTFFGEQLTLRKEPRRFFCIAKQSSFYRPCLDQETFWVFESSCYYDYNLFNHSRQCHIRDHTTSELAGL